MSQSTQNGGPEIPAGSGSGLEGVCRMGQARTTNLNDSPQTSPVQKKKKRPAARVVREVKTIPPLPRNQGRTARDDIYRASRARGAHPRALPLQGRRRVRADVSSRVRPRLSIGGPIPLAHALPELPVRRSTFRRRKRRAVTTAPPGPGPTSSERRQQQ